MQLDKSIPHSLAEVKTEQDAEAWFYQLTRHIDSDTAARIKNNAVSCAERHESPLLDAACEAWDKVLTFTDGVIVGESLHMRA
jgi:hypothetical protein